MIREPRPSWILRFWARGCRELFLSLSLPPLLLWPSFSPIISPFSSLSSEPSLYSFSPLAVLQTTPMEQVDTLQSFPQTQPSSSKSNSSRSTKRASLLRDQEVISYPNVTISQSLNEQIWNVIWILDRNSWFEFKYQLHISRRNSFQTKGSFVRFGKPSGLVFDLLAWNLINVIWTCSVCFSFPSRSRRSLRSHPKLTFCSLPHHQIRIDYSETPDESNEAERS